MIIWTVDVWFSTTFPVNPPAGSTNPETVS